MKSVLKHFLLRRTEVFQERLEKASQAERKVSDELKHEFLPVLVSFLDSFSPPSLC